MPNPGMGSPERFSSEPKFEPRFASSTNKMRTGVDIPAAEKVQTRKLLESFRGLDPQYQRKIITIIEDLREEAPKMIPGISRQIGEFFNDLGDPRKKYVDLNTFLDNLQEQIKNEKPASIN